MNLKLMMKLAKPVAPNPWRWHHGPRSTFHKNKGVNEKVFWPASKGTYVKEEQGE